MVIPSVYRYTRTQPVNKPLSKLRVSLWNSLLGSFLHRSCIFFYIFCYLLCHPDTNNKHWFRSLPSVRHLGYWMYDENSSTKNTIRKMGLQHHSFRVSDVRKQLKSREIRLSRDQYINTNILQKDWTIGFVVVYDITISLQRQVALHQLSRTLEWPFLKFLSGE